MNIMNLDTVQSSPTGDPWLLTPGPLTTSPTVKQAMLHDLGSRDRRFIDVNASIRQRLVNIIGGDGSHECVPLQGSGTFVVEAMLITFVPRGGKLLVLQNGAYGKRIARICQVHARPYEVMEWGEDTPVDPAAVADRLGADKSITHVVVVHCETTSGILNPLQQVADVVADHGRALLVDAMSAFGAIDVQVTDTRFDALAASSNKCLEGVPGLGFCLARRQALEATEGNADSLALDLYDQWHSMEGNGQWRFTPPTHCLLAMHQALDEFAEEGGVAGRGGRYTDNCRVLVDGMRAMGFETLLADDIQAPIIITFHMPAHRNFDFRRFYDALSAAGFVIYPGKLTVAESFRIGCIGRLGRDQIALALKAVAAVLNQMGVVDGRPNRG